MFYIDPYLIGVYIYRFITFFGFFFIFSMIAYLLVSGATVPKITFVFLAALSMLIENRVFHSIFEIDTEERY